MMQAPFGPGDRAWLVKRTIILGFALASHPLAARDLHDYGIYVTSRTADAVYVTFVGAQCFIFTWAVFYADAFPGMRRVFAFATERRAEGLAKAWPWAVVLLVLLYAILTAGDFIVHVTPPGLPHFDAATAYFVVERLVAIVVFLIIADDDDDPRATRRRIKEALLRPFRMRAKVAVTRTAG